MRHHYVPQFLLRKWSDSTVDGKLTVFRIDSDELTSSSRAPKYTAFEDNLYALSRDNVAGMEQQANEEKFLKIIDSRAAPILTKLLRGGLRILTNRERSDWVYFLMSLRVRQPDIVSRLQIESAKLLSKKLASQPNKYEELKQSSDPTTLEEWAENEFPSLIENFGPSIFPNMVLNEPVGNRILNMKWWIWDFSKVQHDLLLADNPSIHTTGINDQNLIIALPISPKKAFLATQADHVAETLRKQDAKSLAIRLNDSSVGNAKRRIFASNRSPERYIRNRLLERRASGTY